MWCRGVQEKSKTELDRMIAGVGKEAKRKRDSSFHKLISRVVLHGGYIRQKQ